MFGNLQKIKGCGSKSGSYDKIRQKLTKFPVIIEKLSSHSKVQIKDGA